MSETLLRIVIIFGPMLLIGGPIIWLLERRRRRMLETERQQSAYELPQPDEFALQLWRHSNITLGSKYAPCDRCTRNAEGEGVRIYYGKLINQRIVGIGETKYTYKPKGVIDLFICNACTTANSKAIGIIMVTVGLSMLFVGVMAFRIETIENIKGTLALLGGGAAALVFGTLLLTNQLGGYSRTYLARQIARKKIGGGHTFWSEDEFGKLEFDQNQDK